jgi:cytochrome c556
MRMKHSSSLIVLCLIFGVTLSAFPQTRRHDQIMKDVAATFAEIKKSLDAKKGEDAAQNALKLADLTKEVEAFWVPLRSNVALTAARDLRSVSEKIAAAAANDLTQANTIYLTAGAKCKSCHDRHRAQMPDNSFRILP